MDAELDQQFKKLHLRFNALDKSFNSVGEQLDSIETRLENIPTRGEIGEILTKAYNLATLQTEHDHIKKILREKLGVEV